MGLGTWVVLGLTALPLVLLGFQALDVGIQDILGVWGRAQTWWALGRTVGLALGVTGASVVFAVALCWWTRMTDLPGASWFRALLFMPLAFPSYVTGFVVMLAFAPGGVLEPLWRVLGKDIYGGLGATVALLFSFPLVSLQVFAALDRVDWRQWDCARSLGARPFTAFFRVVLPQLGPSIGAGAALVALYVIGDFGAVSLMRFNSLSRLIYLRHRSLFDRDEAVAYGLLLVVLALLLVVALVWFERRQASAHRHVDVRPPRIPLGAWKWPVLAVCGAAVLLGVVLPVGLVVQWWWRGISLGTVSGVGAVWGDAAFHSIALGAATAVVVVVLSGSVVMGSTLEPVRKDEGHPRHFFGAVKEWGLQGSVYVAYALPGIVVALSLVSFATRHMFWVYQTLLFLGAAYVIRFVALGVQTMGNGMAQQPRSWVQAGRTLGRSPLGVIRDVVLPNAWPAIGATAVAVWVMVIKELPITLILGPVGFRTLSTEVWGLAEDAYFAQVAPVVVIMVLCAFAGLLIQQRLGSIPGRGRG